MVCYARLYGRETREHRRRLWEELSNLNNRVVVLLPDWSVIEDRYHDRGDEIQDLESLRSLHKLFYEETQKIKGLPNVFVLDDPKDMVLDSIDGMYNLENQTPTSMGKLISDFVKFSGSKEVSPLRFSIHFDDVQHWSDPDIMSHPPEENYYKNILTCVMRNIDDECQGLNDNALKQDPLTTRRFIYTQDSCVSLVHTMLRDDILNIHVVCRSSDVVNTFPYDLKFLVYLVDQIKKKLNVDVPCVLNCTLNSAHIIDD
jgi:hypothetical protein